MENEKKEPIKGWVEVLVTYDLIEAEIVKDILESGGIPVVIRSGKVRPFPVNIGKMGAVKVLVRKEDKEAAEKIIKGSNNDIIYDKEGHENGENFTE